MKRITVGEKIFLVSDDGKEIYSETDDTFTVADFVAIAFGKTFNK